MNLENLFYEDFYGAKWKVNVGEVRTLTWSAVNDSLRLPHGHYESVTASLDNYLGDIRKAFQVWDDAIESIKFLETTTGNSADITIAATDLGGFYGYWNYNWDSNKYITKSTIRFNRHYLDNGWILTTAMHEIGNILGLGDLRVSSQYTSVQEDPLPQKFNGNQLWDFDQQMISTLYPSTINITGNHDQVIADLENILIDYAGAVTLTDVNDTSITAAELALIGSKTTGTVTVSNAVHITGSTAETTAALVTAETRVVASTANVTVNGTSTVSEINAIAASTSGVVTATLGADSLANLADLTTAGTDVINVTVNDAAGAVVSASDLSTLGEKTVGTVTVPNAVAITGDHDQLTAALVTTGTKVEATVAVVIVNDPDATAITASELVQLVVRQMAPSLLLMLLRLQVLRQK